MPGAHSGIVDCYRSDCSMIGAESTRTLKIALALGSGSARGLSHIGVLQELAALGIAPDIVCGTSIGALVGGASLDADEFARICKLGR